MKPFRAVAELTTDQSESFAVLSIDPTERHEDGGCKAVVLSLHETRKEADQAAGCEA